MAKSHRICSIPECGKRHVGRGYCKNHLQRVVRNGHPNLLKPPIITCTISGCGKPHKAKGYCSRHYSNFRRFGHPEKSSTPNGAPAAFIDRIFKEPLSDSNCVVWPFAKNSAGYGQIRVNGQTKYVHRITCEKMHGPPPTLKHEAAHSCGNGHLGCINPHHLSWKTHYQNHQDRHLHGSLFQGEACPSAKLTADDVIDIRRLSTMETPPKIAKRYGVSRRTISDILAGKTWRHLT